MEPRNGVLHVFMPPVRYIEDYLDLVARIEETRPQLLHLVLPTLKEEPPARFQPPDPLGHRG